MRSTKATRGFARGLKKGLAIVIIAMVSGFVAGRLAYNVNAATVYKTSIDTENVSELFPTESVSIELATQQQSAYVDVAVSEEESIDTENVSELLPTESVPIELATQQESTSVDVAASEEESIDTENVSESASTELDTQQQSASVDVAVPQEEKFLLSIDDPDPNYVGQVVNLTEADRQLAYNLVFGEAGDQDYIGCCLVAQAMRDSMIYNGWSDISTLIRKGKYSGATTKGTNDNAVAAVNYIFSGSSAVQHRVLYFYSPRWCKSRWHETQNFVVTYGCHKFFDAWN